MKIIVTILFIMGVIYMAISLFDIFGRRRKAEAKRTAFLKKYQDKILELENQLLVAYKKEDAFKMKVAAELDTSERKLDKIGLLTEEILKNNQCIVDNYESLVLKVSLLAELATSGDENAALSLKDDLDLDIAKHKETLKRYKEEQLKQQQEYSSMIKNNGIVREMGR